MKNNGFSMIAVIFIISVLMLLAVSAGYMAISSASSLKSQKEYLSAYYLAEAGIEYAKAQLRSNPGWCTPGQTINANGGSVEIKKEPGKPNLYAVGNAGRARVIIDLDVIGNNSYIQREE